MWPIERKWDDGFSPQIWSCHVDPKDRHAQRIGDTGRTHMSMIILLGDSRKYPVDGMNGDCVIETNDQYDIHQVCH